MSHNRTIIFCPPASAEPLIDQLRHDIKKRKRIVAIAPTAYAVKELELSLLGSSGVSAMWDRAVFTFAGFAKYILGDLNRKPLGHAAQMFVLERAASRTKFDYYRNVGWMTGFLGLVRDFIQELKEALVLPVSFYEKVIKPLRDSAGRELMPEIARLVEISGLISGYQEIAQELGGDDEDLIFSAANLLAEKKQKNVLDKFILFGFSDLSFLQWFIFESTVRAFEPSEIIFVMPFPKDIVENPDVLGFDAARRTIDRLKSLGFSEAEFEGNRTAFNLFASSVLTGSVFDRADADVEMLEFFDEQEEIEGALRQWQLEAKRFEPEQAVVLHRQSQNFGANFWTSLWHNSRHLNDHLSPQLARNIVPNLLVEFMGALDSQDPATLFAAIKHIEASAKLPEIWREEADSLWQVENIDIKEILSKLPISDDLKNFISSSMEKKKPAEWLDITRSFAYKVLAPRLLESSLSQMGVLNDFMDELNDLNEKRLFADSEISLGEWHKLCVRTLDLMRAFCGSIFFYPVRSPFEIRGGSADCVILCGLNLKDFPNQPQESVFLSDRARHYLLSKNGLRLRTTEEIYKEEWPLFYQAVSAAQKKLVLTRYKYVKRDAEVIPSPFWDSAERALNRSGVPMRNNVEPKKAAGKKCFDKEKVVSMGENATSLLRSWLNVERADSARVCDEKSPKRCASVTSLDDLVKCPYLLFANRILSLSSREDKTPEEKWQRMRGVVMHKAIEQMLQRQLVWNRDGVKALLKDVATNEIARQLSEEQLAELEIWAAKLISAFDDFQLFRQALGMKRLSVERKEQIIYEVGEHKFNLTGRPDLVDQTEQGVVIVDFKTSKPSWIEGSVKKIGQGTVDEITSVQLPLYAQVKYSTGKLLAIAILGLRSPALYIIARKDFEDELNKKFVGKYERLKNFVMTFQSRDNLEEFLKEFLDGSLKNKLKSLLLGRVERSLLKDTLCERCDARDFCRSPLL